MLSLKDADITKAVTLKHYKELCAAAKLDKQPDKVALVKTFRQKFNAASLPDNEEKEWVQLVTEAIGFLKKPGGESFDWLSAFRKKLPGVNTPRFSQIVKTLGASAPALIEVFGASANMETLKSIAAAYSAGLPSWLEECDGRPRALLVQQA